MAGPAVGPIEDETNVAERVAPCTAGLVPVSNAVLSRERDDPQVVQMTVWVSVSQAQGELIALVLGGHPFIDCDQLITIVGLYLPMEPRACSVPCHLDVAIDR